jgi:F0F1-type ATP synthase assembly protein I
MWPSGLWVSVVDPARRDDEMIRYATLAQLGAEMVAPLVVGLVLDYQLGTLPWLMLAGAVIGFAGGFWHLLIILKRKTRPKDEAGRRGAS